VSRRPVLLFLETIIFSVTVLGSVVLWIPRDVLGIWGQTTPTSWSVRHVVATAPLLLGLGIYLRCLWKFAARGRGIPAPVDHPKQLVVSGLYQYVRNPMYVGVMLFLLGEALFFGSPRFLLYAIAWLAFVHTNVPLYEEPYLRRKFGGSYEQYSSAVHRWIPGKKYRPAGGP
jgi:protein-S-isoprenylcysteine O-methyltransferase Ste14